MFTGLMDQHDYIFKKLNSSSLTDKEKKQIIEFANKVRKDIPASYIISRFHKYNKLMIYLEGEQLKAVEFFDEFTSEGKRYFYLGSLFSHQGFFLPMFHSWLQSEVYADELSEFYMLAEFQAPEVFLIFKSLFFKYSYPSFTDENVPEEIVNVLYSYKMNIAHIKNLNPQTFSTSSQETFYVYKEKYKYIVQWMKSRGVFPDRGHNQLLLVQLQAHKRMEVMEDLKKIINGTSHWMSFKEKMLSDFKNIIKQYV